MQQSSARSSRGRTLLALALCAAGLGGCGDAPKADNSHPIPLRAETVHLTPLAMTARYAAVIKPRREADLGFRVGGKMVARLVDVGARVDAGTTLARLDPSDLELQAQATEAQLVSVRADAANARSDFERSVSLRRSEWTTQQEYDKRRAALETTQARVNQLEAQLRVARNAAQYTTLDADGPGVVTAVLVEPGQVVSQGQTIFKVARLGETEVEADLPEQHVAELADDDLKVELWSLPGIAITAKLREVSPSANPTTRTYQVRATLIDPPAQLQLGMTASLIATDHRSGTAAILPTTALTKRGSDPAVWVVNSQGDGIELRSVLIGSYSGDRVILSAGLSDGERVVTAGVHKLDASQKVRIWAEPAR